MKHILLPLLLLIPISLFPANGAASATPAAGAAAGASVEGDAKRGDADVKNDAALLSLDAVRQSVIPEASKYIPAHLACLVAESLVERKNLVPLYAQRVRLLQNYLLDRALELAEPQPRWRSVVDAINDGFRKNQIPFLGDLAQIIGDYAQSDLLTIAEIFNRMMPQSGQGQPGQIGIFMTPPQEFVELANSMQALELAQMCSEFLRQHGRVFPYDTKTLNTWREAGFKEESSAHTIIIAPDTMTCHGCLAVYEAEGNRTGRYRIEGVLEGHLFGEVHGTGFSWRNPLLYHREGCGTLAGIKATTPNVLQSAPPVFRSEPKKFAEYILLQCDLHVRRTWGTGEHAPQWFSDARRLWMTTIFLLGCTFAPESQDLHAFLEDPNGWVDRENSRAQELGLSMRYPSPKKKDQPK